MANKLAPLEVRKLARAVYREIEGGWLYGHPVDMNSVDFMVAAAYWAGRHKAMETSREEFRDMWKLLFPNQ